jgi:hypothetical protein
MTNSVEVFYFDANSWSGEDMWCIMENGEVYESGWYFWYCKPGCLPDSDPYGPYSSRAAAEAAVMDELEYSLGADPADLIGDPI